MPYKRMTEGEVAGWRSRVERLGIQLNLFRNSQQILEPSIGLPDTLWNLAGEYARQAREAGPDREAIGNDLSAIGLSVQVRDSGIRVRLTPEMALSLQPTKADLADVSGED